MAVSEPHEHHIPGVLGGDLPKKELQAFEEGHDSDVPPQQSTSNDRDTAALEAEKEKLPDTSSNISEEGDADLEKGKPSEAVDEEKELQDPNIVDWEGPDDPENPQNWSAAKKWSNIGILSFLTLLTPLASSMFAPGVPDVIGEFHSTKYEYRIYHLIITLTRIQCITCHVRGLSL
jgi:hypothetical protein